MNPIDIALGALLLYGMVQGFMKGFFVEIASLVALVAGVYGAIHFSHFVADFLKNIVSWEGHYISMTSFGITFLCILIAVVLLGKVFTRIADFAALGLLNRLLGSLFGLLKAGVILSVLLILFTHTNNTFGFVKKETLKESFLYEKVKKLASLISPSIPDINIDREKIE